jgi:hypothetical protein
MIISVVGAFNPDAALIEVGKEADNCLVILQISSF